MLAWACALLFRNGASEASLGKCCAFSQAALPWPVRSLYPLSAAARRQCPRSADGGLPTASSPVIRKYLFFSVSCSACEKAKPRSDTAESGARSTAGSGKTAGRVIE